MNRIIVSLGLMVALSGPALTCIAHLEGQPALRLDGRLHLGPRVPSFDESKGRIVLLFFWAHWCADCKADSATVAAIVEKYRSQGLTIIAPTRRYGFIGGGRPAAPDRELRHLVDVRDADYAFLRDQPIPISDANYERYGVDAIPTYVLIDKQGVIRLFHPGRMAQDELAAAIRPLL
jgi:thiol-disulfide isomerase/thioredoxin